MNNGGKPDKFKLVGRFFRYGLVGVTGTVVHMGTLVVLVEIFLIKPLFASTTGFILALMTSYILNRTWTFKVKKKNSKYFIKYAMVSLLGLLLNNFIMYITVYLFKWWYLLGQMSVITIVPVINFILNNFYTFNEETNKVKR